jgi:hypothetical protein
MIKYIFFASILFFVGCNSTEKQDAVTLAEDGAALIVDSDKVAGTEKLVADGVKTVEDVIDSKKTPSTIKV